MYRQTKQERFQAKPHFQCDLPRGVCNPLHGACPVECEHYSMGSTHFQSLGAGLTSISKE